MSDEKLRPNTSQGKKVHLKNRDETAYLGEFGSAEFKDGYLWINGRCAGSFDEDWFYLSPELADLLNCRQGPWNSVEIR